jgi:hypothetical protein
LDARLGLGRSALYRWLDELRADGLVRTDDDYALTPAGAEALSIGTVKRSVSERRRFTFLLGPDGSAHFLPWKGPIGTFVPALASAADVRWLAECMARPAAWKRRVQFPEDVADIEAGSNASGAAAWKRLAIAHGERATVVLMLTSDMPPHLIGFAVEHGDPDPAAPSLRLKTGWDEIFPELAAQAIADRTDVGGRALFGGGRLRRVERRAQ